MKTLSILAYTIGCILLVISCFTTGVAITWWLGGAAVLFLIIGCICQYNTARKRFSHHDYHY